MKLLCRQHGETAVATLVRAMRSRNLRVAILAAQALLDRGYGRPVQAVAQTDPDGQPVHPGWVILDKEQIARLPPDANLPGAPPQPQTDSPSIVIIPAKDVLDPETGESIPARQNGSAKH